MISECHKHGCIAVLCVGEEEIEGKYVALLVKDVSCFGIWMAVLRKR